MTSTTTMTTAERRDLARSVIDAEDRSDELIYAAALAVAAGRWSDAADLVAEAVELDTTAAAIRAEVAA